MLDSALLDLSLADPFPHHSKPKAPLHANKFQAISWQDVDRKCIQFGGSCTRPFRQACTLHDYLAWDFQLDRQCLPDSFDTRGILTSQWSCEEVSGEVSDWLYRSAICALEAGYVVASQHFLNTLTAAQAHLDPRPRCICPCLTSHQTGFTTFWRARYNAADAYKYGFDTLQNFRVV